MTRWWRDLALGARLALSGGREGRARLLLTAVAIGLGAALLMATTALPAAQEHRERRMASLEPGRSDPPPPPKSDQSLLIRPWQTLYRGHSIVGLIVKPEGPAAPVPPGLDTVPQPGQMFVSPELHRLLDSPRGELLRPRLPYRIVGTIGKEGLPGPSSYRVYIGSNDLAPGDGSERIIGFGGPVPEEAPFSPMQLLLVVIIFVVLLLPIAVFVIAAVRFGGEQRDRRLRDVS